MPTPPAKRTTRPAIALAVTGVLLAGSVVAIASSPALRDNVAASLSPDAQAAQTQRARADDLKRQRDALDVERVALKSALGRATAAAGDTTSTARADDLKSQIDALTAKINDLSARAADAEAARDAQLGRSTDLVGQLDTANGRAGKAEGDLASSQAATADLRRQVAALSAKAAQPRPTVTVTAAPTPAPTVTASPRPTTPTPPKVYPVLTKKQVLASKNLFGMYTQESPFFNKEFDATETAVNRDANLTGYFQSWATPFRADVVQASWKRGEIPLLTWESQLQIGESTADQPAFSNAQILSGRYDDYIRTYARAIAANGQPLVLRFDHEMNGVPGWYPWGEGLGWNPVTQKRDIPTNGNEVGSYVAMWKHVWSIFETEGANDVTAWLWSPSRIDTFQTSGKTQDFMDSLYPGDDYVDLVGMSGYFRNGYAAGTDYSDVFDATLKQVRTTAPDKPILLAEVGASQSAGDKAAYVRSFFAGLADDSDVMGFAWFSEAIGPNDWRITSSDASIDAFRDGVNTSRFGRAK